MNIREHFTALVVGDNHDELMKKYDNNLLCEPYKIFEFAKTSSYKENTLKLYEKLLQDADIDSISKTFYEYKISEISNMDDADFYISMTQDYTIDKETGDAYSTMNKNGKYDSCNIGKAFAYPLICNDGKECYSAKIKDVNFSKIHFANTFPYEVAWNTVINKQEPSDDFEKNIYNNMKDKEHYLRKFNNMDEYIAWSTAFWCYAYVDQDNWIDLDSSGKTQMEWVCDFYKTFIEPLDENETITIYECLI